jgi:hypothetical protein
MPKLAARELGDLKRAPDTNPYFPQAAGTIESPANMLDAKEL